MELARLSINEARGGKALLQSRFWAAFKRQRGHTVEAYRRGRGGNQRQLVIIYRRFTESSVYGYVPYGPEMHEPAAEHGIMLEELAEDLRPLLPDDCAFLRFDLPWKNPFLPETEPALTRKNSGGLPETRVREMRMNFGSSNWNLVKAPTDMQPTDTVLLDLRRPEKSILDSMKPKTRYNIRLAQRKNLRVTVSSRPDLSRWHALYRKTAERKRIVNEDLRYFQDLFRLSETYSPRLFLLEAYTQNTLIAGIIIALYMRRAYYLYGASSYEHRDMMAPHLLQWEAIRLAKENGGSIYDLFGIPLYNRPSHPMYGLYRFKTGFGGSIHHWRGCWDYPYDMSLYRQNSIRSAVDNAYHVSS